MENISEKNIENRNLVSEKAAKIWQIRISVIFVLYTVLSGILFFVLPVLCIIFLSIVVILYILIMFFYIPAVTKIIGYRFEKDHLILNKGFFTRREIIVRFSKIQYAVMFEGIIEKRLGLASIDVLLAGSNVILWELSKEDAVILKKKIDDFLHMSSEEIKT